MKVLKLYKVTIICLLIFLVSCGSNQRSSNSLAPFDIKKFFSTDFKSDTAFERKRSLDGDRVLKSKSMGSIIIDHTNGQNAVVTKIKLPNGVIFEPIYRIREDRVNPHKSYSVLAGINGVFNKKDFSLKILTRWNKTYIEPSSNLTKTEAVDILHHLAVIYYYLFDRNPKLTAKAYARLDRPRYLLWQFYGGYRRSTLRFSLFYSEANRILNNRSPFKTAAKNLDQSKTIKNKQYQTEKNTVIPETLKQLLESKSKLKLEDQVLIYKAATDTFNLAKYHISTGSSAEAVKLLTIASKKLHWRGDLLHIHKIAITQYVNVTNNITNNCRLINDRYNFLEVFSPDNANKIKIPKGCNLKRASSNKHNLKYLISFRSPDTDKKLEQKYSKDLLEQLEFTINKNKSFPYDETLTNVFAFTEKYLKDLKIICENFSISPDETSKKISSLLTECRVEGVKHPKETYELYEETLATLIKQLELKRYTTTLNINKTKVNTSNPLSNSYHQFTNMHLTDLTPDYLYWNIKVSTRNNKNISKVFSAQWGNYSSHQRRSSELKYSFDMSALDWSSTSRLSELLIKIHDLNLISRILKMKENKGRLGEDRKYFKRNCGWNISSKCHFAINYDLNTIDDNSRVTQLYKIIFNPRKMKNIDQIKRIEIRPNITKSFERYKELLEYLLKKKKVKNF